MTGDAGLNMSTFAVCLTMIVCALAIFLTMWAIAN
jgi:hypothetical protein